MSISILAPCNSGDVRLYGTALERAGIVHVCVNGTWGKVCGGENDPHFASVICSQLGYSPYGMFDNNIIRILDQTVNLLQVLFLPGDYGVMVTMYFTCTIPIVMGMKATSLIVLTASKIVYHVAVIQMQCTQLLAILMPILMSLQ